ncbi:MAG: DUF58 domain-containing protein, partial [Deltaproteobacteria bacterium]|nr:DUF58 domain-containing protein [Deltaproteobacteria bacterium]
MSFPTLTSEGAVAAAVVGIAAVVAAGWGSNALAFAAAAGLSAWALAILAGWLNLRGLVVRRELPSEVFAGVEAPGTLVLANEARFASSGLAVTDGTATARVDGVGPGVERRAPVSWRFAHRGEARLGAVDVASVFPFGWLRWQRRLHVPEELVIFPRPIEGRSRAGQTREAEEGAEQGRGGGDWIGIRPWRDGDSARQVHWPSSARIGDWMVVERSGTGERTVEIVLDPALSHEHALSVASWEVLTAPGAVGLV